MKNKKEEIKIEGKTKKEHYIGYKERIIFLTLSIIIFGFISVLLVRNIFGFDKETIVTYKENGTMDYRVYLKPNDFYENEYLGKNMQYVASLIKNIDVDVDYKFDIATESDINLAYEIVGVLSIYNEGTSGTLFEKEYTLVSLKELKAENSLSQNISEKLSLDYDYYNSLANNFKTVYGVDANSDFTIYVKVKNAVDTINLNEEKEMMLTIPLTQKTINISMEGKDINVSNSIVQRNKIPFLVNSSIVLLVVIILILAISLIKLIQLVRILVPKKSKYEKTLRKLLVDYDRIIAEVSTMPNFEDTKKLIRVEKFEELIDLADNLNKPIIYYNVLSNHKSYFYVDQYPVCYLFVLKASDLEEVNAKK